jgi:hypothetical protein
VQAAIHPTSVLAAWPNPDRPLVHICVDKRIARAVQVLQLAIPGPALYGVLASSDRYIIGVCSSEMNSLGTANTEAELLSFYRDFVEQYRTTGCHLAAQVQALNSDLYGRLMADFRQHLLTEFAAVGCA